MQEITREVNDEFSRIRRFEEAILRASCLLETHFQKRGSSLLQLFPDLEGQAASASEIEELAVALRQFIDEVPQHGSIPGAVKVLALTKASDLVEFFAEQLKRHLAWQHPVPVYQLLLVLEDLGEAVFRTADGSFISSSSACDTEVNFGIARRYLDIRILQK